MNSNDNFEISVTQILDKYNLMNPTKATNQRHNNSSKQYQKGGKKPSPSNNNFKSNSNQKYNRGFSIPDEVWKTLTKEQKDTILASRKKNMSSYTPNRGPNQWKNLTKSAEHGTPETTMNSNYRRKFSLLPNMMQKMTANKILLIKKRKLLDL